MLWAIILVGTLLNITCLNMLALNFYELLSSNGIGYVHQCVCTIQQILRRIKTIL